MKTSRAVLATLTVVAACAAVALVGTVLWWFGANRGQPTPYTKPPAVDGRTVEVTYVGSSCQDGSRLQLDEAGDEVVATVYAWQHEGTCDDVGISYTLTGTLERDLGQRPLVDGACRLADFRQHGDCASP